MSLSVRWIRSYYLPVWNTAGARVGRERRSNADREHVGGDAELELTAAEPRPDARHPAGSCRLRQSVLDQCLGHRLGEDRVVHHRSPPVAYKGETTNLCGQVMST